MANKIHNPYGFKIHMDYGFSMDFQPKSLWIMDFLWILNSYWIMDFLWNGYGFGF